MPFGYTWGELGNAGLAGLDGPRQAIWNLGPTLVGRPGQGPQNGRELLGAIGMNSDSPMAHGLGKGIDLVANPMNLAGMGMFGRASGAGGAAPEVAAAARSAAPSSASLAGRLETMAGPGLQGSLATRPASGALGGISEVAGASAAPVENVAAQMAARGPARPTSNWASTRPPTQAPLPAGTPPGGIPQSFPMAPDVSPSWLQQAPGPRGFPNFPTPLATERFLQQGAGAAAPAAASSGGSILDRLQRMTPQGAPRIDY